MSIAGRSWQPMNKLLLGDMNNNKRYNRPSQLQVNVTRTMAILEYVQWYYVCNKAKNGLSAVAKLVVNEFSSHYF